MRPTPVLDFGVSVGLFDLPQLKPMPDRRWTTRLSQRLSYAALDCHHSHTKCLRTLFSASRDTQTHLLHLTILEVFESFTQQAVGVKASGQASSRLGARRLSVATSDLKIQSWSAYRSLGPSFRLLELTIPASSYPAKPQTAGFLTSERLVGRQRAPKTTCRCALVQVALLQYEHPQRRLWRCRIPMRA